MMPASILATPLINLRSESVYAGKHDLGGQYIPFEGLGMKIHRHFTCKLLTAFCFDKDYTA